MDTTVGNFNSRNEMEVSMGKTDNVIIMEHPKEATIMGLHEWYVHVFTHLGWMVLCRENIAKIKVYHKSIESLHDHLVERAQSANDDNKRDLTIMIKKVSTLKTEVETLFANELSQQIQLGGAKKKPAKKVTKSKSKSADKKKPVAKKVTKSKTKSKSKSKSADKKKPAKEPKSTKAPTKKW